MSHKYSQTWCNFSSSRRVYTCDKSYWYINNHLCMLTGQEPPSPHPLGGGVPYKSDWFQGFKYIVCYLLECLNLKCIYQHSNGLGTFWVLAGKNVSWTIYQKINFQNWYLSGVKIVKISDDHPVTFISEFLLPQALNIILTRPIVKSTSMCIFLIPTLLICGAHQYATRHLAHKHCRIFFA